MKMKFECFECGHKFIGTVTKNMVEKKCPKCKGYDVEPDYMATVVTKPNKVRQSSYIT